MSLHDLRRRQVLDGNILPLTQSLTLPLTGKFNSAPATPPWTLLTDLPPELNHDLSNAASITATSGRIDTLANLGTLGAVGNWTATTNGRPEYDSVYKRAIFNAGNYLGSADLAGFNTTGALSVFIVFERRTATGGVEAIFNQYNTGSSRRSFSIGINATGNPYVVVSSNGSTDLTTLTLSSVVVDTFDVNILSFVHDPATNTQVLRWNGNDLYSGSTTAAAGLFNTTAAIGINLINGVATGNFQGSLFESVGYNSALSIADIENVEGFLAQKWDAILADYVEADTNPPVLDQMGISASAAYSLRRLRRDYAGYAIRVRRSSDNAEQDISFSYDDGLDTVSLLAFVGAGNGFVTTDYDQASNKNAVQATAANQPRIVNAGVLEVQNSKAAIRALNASQTRLDVASITVGSYHYVFSDPVPSGPGTFRALSCGATNRLRHLIGQAQPVGTICANGVATLNGYIDGTAVPSLANFNAFSTGIAITPTSHVISITRTTPVTDGVQIFWDNLLTTRGWDGFAQEIVYFPAALTDTQRQTLERNQGTYYGITVA